MTVDEAIICLSDMKIKVAIPKAAVQARLNNDALDIAIETLNCSEIPNNSDTISRQQAIESLRKMQTYKLFAGDDMILVDKAQVQTELMDLPSAQPNIIRCKDCAYCDSDVVDAPYGMTKKVWWCDRLYAGANENLIIEPDDFCSWAERREVTE